MINYGPESPEMVAHYRKNQTEYTEIADALSIPKLTDEAFREMTRLLGSEDSTRLVESVARSGNFGDKVDHAQLRKSVSELLKKEGTRLPRGKRTKPEMESLVSTMTPLLLFLGVKSASSERSHLVRALRVLAETFELDGDPRDELRRVIEKDRKLREAQKQAVVDMFRRAWGGLRPK